MATHMVRQGEPKGLVGWPGNPSGLTNHKIRLCVKVNARGKSQLNLSHHGLSHIPQQVFQFQQLEILTLSHNHLEQLPPMISYLRGIRTLHLQHNLLTTLPPTLVNCRHLSELDLTHNRLASLPKGVGGLKSLRVLKLGENELEQIPHELGNLSNLRVLDLHSNRLWYIPFSLQNLYRLLRLDVSNNLFDQIPMVVTKLTWLRALDVSKNRLAALPPDFDQMRELRELNLGENRFVTLGVMATKLRQVKYLSLSHNRLQFLPDQISQMKNLRVLHLKDNCLEALPDNFPQLKYLNAAHNKLKHFSVLGMPELVAMDASANQLETLPRGVFNLKHLQRMNLAQNWITEVPEDIGWLKKLQLLDLSENDLRSLPASLHFLEKLTSFNVRGNHKLSRIPLKPHEDLSLTKTDQEEKHEGKRVSRQSTQRSVKKKQAKTHLLRKYPSMPSLRHPPFAQPDNPPDPTAKSMRSSDFPPPDHVPQQNRTWLDNFLLAKPQRRTSWDANATSQMVRTVPYPADESYDVGEIQASFSAESLTHDDKNFHDPLTTMSFRSDDEDSALEASFSSCDDFTPKHHSFSNSGNVWTSDQTIPKTPSSSRKAMKSVYTSTSSKKSAAASVDDHTHKKMHYLHMDDPTEKANSYYPTQAAAAYNRSHDQTEMKLPYNAEHHLGIYNYHDSEASSSEPRPMNVLLTNLSQPNSQPSTVRAKHKPTRRARDKGTQMLRSDSNWTMRSHLSEPLTIHTWTQTGPPEPTNIHAQTQTSSLTPSRFAASETQNPSHTYTFTGLRSPDSPPMVASMGGYSQTRQKFLENAHPSGFHPSPAPSTSTQHPPTNDSRVNLSSGMNSASLQQDKRDPRSRLSGQAKSTDYTLLGVCNQIQTLLHKDLLQPVIGYNGQHTGRFSNKTIQRGRNGAWHFGHNPAQQASQQKLEAGLEYSPGETFTTTERGGHYVSAFCPHVEVSVPPGATDCTLHVTLQQLTISNQVLKAIGEVDNYVSNLVSIGPIVFLHALEKVTFTSPVTLTLPAPPKVKGYQGHLVVVSVRADNTCVPCVTGYQSSRREVTLTTWHMTGKVAVLSKAKCKYKACKSVEQLLATLNIIAMNASKMDH